MGKLENLSVQKLLDTHHLDLMTEKGGKDGLMVIKRARLVGHGSSASDKATQEMESTANNFLAQQSLDQAKAVAAQCKERAAELLKMAEEKEKQANEAKEETAQAQKDADDLQSKVDELKEQSKSRSCTGKLQLKLRGGGLPDMDGLTGWINKSDPFYQLYGATGYVQKCF